MREVVEGVRALFRPREMDAELDEELAFHLEQAILKNVHSGMDAETARLEAYRAFGGVERTKEQVRDERGARALHDLLGDVRYGLRSLRRSPGYAAVVVVTLALGIGANTAVFSLVDGVFLEPLPHGDGDRLMVLTQRVEADDDEMGFSVLDVRDFSERTRSFDGLAEYHSMSFTLLGAGEPQLVNTGVVSADFFELMGMEPVLGRGFTEADNVLGAEPVLVLSWEYWQERFDADPDIVGRRLRMNDREHTVVGVLPRVPQYPRYNDVYMPTAACPTRSSAEVVADRSHRMMRVFGRLSGAATLATARVELGEVASAMEAAHPVHYPGGRGYTATADPLQDVLVRDARAVFALLFGTAAFVLLVACANVANLALARAACRERELAVRSALGAGTRRIARQLLSESTILALVGGVLGLGIAVLGVDMLTAFARRFTPRADSVSVDTTVLVFTFGVSVLTGLLFGIAPAARGLPAGTAVLKEGTQTARRSKVRIQRGLVVAQVAAAFVLLVGSGLLLRSLFVVFTADPGFESDGRFTVAVSLGMDPDYDDRGAADRFMRRVLAEVRALPEVDGAVRTTSVPMDAFSTGLHRFAVTDRSYASELDMPIARAELVDPDYFDLLGIPVLAGTGFPEESPSAHDDGAWIGVVNETFREVVFEGEDPIGRTVTSCFRDGSCWDRPLTIVGVVGNVHEDGLDRPEPPILYEPIHDGTLGSGRFLVRSEADPGEVGARVAAIVHSVDPDVAVFDFQPLEQLVDRAVAPRRLTTVLITLFSLVALAVTLSGVFGVIAFNMTQRHREFGIRLALGAARAEVVRMVLRQSVGLVVPGLVFGFLGSLLLSRFLGGLLWGVWVFDPVTYVTVAVVLTGASLLGCWLPVERGTRVDPVDAFREV